ncbi:MAG TPA: WG repeat-containing protein, partial [Bacteroidota bacterium]
MRTIQLAILSMLFVAEYTESIGQERLLPIVVDKMYGFINASGAEVISPQYIEGHSFSDGYSLVKKGRWLQSGEAIDLHTGYLTTQGEFKSVHGFDLLGTFHEGLARARRPGFLAFTWSQWGFIDTSLVAAIEPAYDDVGDFSEGLAWVELKEVFLFVVISDTYGYVDKGGKLVIPCRFERAGNFSEGLANVSIDGKRGFINRSGDVVIDARFERVRPFSTGLAAVQVGGKWGYIDTLGSVVIEPGFDDARSFSDGLALVRA